MPTVPNPCDNLEVDLSRTDIHVDLATQPCIDVEVVQPDITIQIGTVANQGPKGDKGDKGDTGDPGSAGPPGSPGLAANVSVGTTTTGAPGSAASVSDSDPTGNAVLNFTIPRGDVGATGPAGQGIVIKGTVPTSSALPTTGNIAGDVWIALDTSHGWAWDGTKWVDIGPIQGPAGPPGTAATATAGATVTSAPGTNAQVSNVGNLNAAVFDFTIPRGNVGATGVQGPKGDPGADSTVPGPSGPPGSAGAPGAAGAAATVATGTTTTGAPGSAANVVNTGSSSAAVFAFTIPRGDVGAAGAPGNPGLSGQAGVNAYTATTAAFTLPGVGSTVPVTVADASWLIVGQMIWVDAGGGVAYPMQVVGIAGNTLTLLNGGQLAATYPYDIAFYINGKPVASAILMRFVFDRAISCAINLAGSVAKVGTAPSGATTFTIAKNGTGIGSLNFASGAASGTFTVAAAQNFVSGDVLTIVAPGTQDANLSDLSVTLSGTRT